MYFVGDFFMSVVRSFLIQFVMYFVRVFSFRIYFLLYVVEFCLSLFR